MISFGQPSLLRRLIINQLLVIVIFAMLAFANLMWHVYRQGSGEIDSVISSQAHSILSVLEPLHDQPEQLAHDAAALFALTRSSFALLKTGRPLGETGFDMAMRVRNLGGLELFLSATSADLPWTSLVSDAQSVQGGGQQWRVHTVHGKDRQLTLQLAQTSDAIDDGFVSNTLRFIVAPLLVFLPCAGLMTWWASRRGLSPLRELALLISRRTPNDMTALGPVAAYTETEPLVNEINSLLRKLKATLARERDFLADAAHELRTPLAVVQAQVHVLQHATTAAERAASADELNIGIGRAASLIQKLLLTARVSSEEFTPRMEVVDLTAFTQERVALLSSLAAKKEIDMELHAPQRLKVQMDRETFVSAVDNVIENAIRYTPAGGRIMIEIDSPNPKQVRLRVADNGVGIPPELHERVFERFFRIGAGDQQGSGLGLSIVKRVLALHGGEVTLSRGTNRQGLTVALTVPRGT